MPVTRTHTATVTGTTTHLLTFEADMEDGMPALTLAGFPPGGVRERRDRVRAAICNSGLAWPGAQVSITATPGPLAWHSSGTDLAMAVAVLTADRQVPADKLPATLFYGELGLDGQVREVPGVLPVLQAAAAGGLFTAVMIPAGNAAEVSLVPGIAVVPVSDLREATRWLRNGPAGAAPPVPEIRNLRLPVAVSHAAGICAAGGHHLSLLGPRGSQAPLVARAVHHLLPALDHAAALEVTAIRAAAGIVPPDGPLPALPPFAAPHYTATVAAMLGRKQPGAMSLAHNGILFLDQAPEFSREVRDALRQPMETGEVVIASAGTIVRFPARFILILAAALCPCPHASTLLCECTPQSRLRYRSRLSGPLADRISLRVVLPVPGTEANPAIWSHEALTAQVADARARAAARLQGTPWQLNAQVPSTYLRQHCRPRPDAAVVLDRATEIGQVSTQGADHALRTAWTIADLAGRPRPTRSDCELALAYLTGTAQ